MLKTNTKLMTLMEAVKGNCGFVFTKEKCSVLRKEIMGRKKQCAAKAGTIAPVDVFVPPGPTGMEPTQTGFFQAMNIPTRINRGQIDIEEEVHIIHKGTKVGASEASLLVKLGIKPFYYGIEVMYYIISYHILTLIFLLTASILYAHIFRLEQFMKMDKSLMHQFWILLQIKLHHRLEI